MAGWLYAYDITERISMQNLMGDQIRSLCAFLLYIVIIL